MSENQKAGIVQFTSPNQDERGKVHSQADEPRENLEDDYLEMRQYCRQLAEFIYTCATPMTIALQGAWGTGKSTLMKLVKNNLGKRPNEVKTISVDTWLYDSLGSQDDLPLVILSDIVRELEDNPISKERLGKEGKRLRKKRNKEDAAKFSDQVETASDYGSTFKPKLAGVALVSHGISAVLRGLLADENAAVAKTTVQAMRDRLELAVLECRESLENVQENNGAKGTSPAAPEGESPDHAGNSTNTLRRPIRRLKIGVTD